MLSQEIRDRVDWRLQELYERHLSLSERLGLHIFADAREDTLLGPGR
jgi:hypothetical protein